MAFPVLIAPMAMQRMAHTDGENAVARAASNFNIPMVGSNYSADYSLFIRTRGHSELRITLPGYCLLAA